MAKVIRKKLTDEELKNMLKRSPLTTNQIASRLGRTTGDIRSIMMRAQEDGLVVGSMIEDEITSRKVNLWSLK